MPRTVEQVLGLPEQAAINRQERSRRREERISAGVDDLARWLEDLVRAGFAEAAARPWTSFEQMSARLVDAQAPGLARFVRQLGSRPHTAPNWPERMFIDLGQLALLLEAWRRRNSLGPGLHAEVRALVGINESRADVLARPAVHDVWDVVGRRVLDGERMRVQRTWLWGHRTRCWALLLDFGVGGQSIQQSVTLGASFEAELCFYSGARPGRALPKSPPLHIGSISSLPGQSIDAALRSYAESLGHNPWLQRVPLALANVVPVCGHEQAWWAVDHHGQRVRLDGPMGWQLLALSGGRPIGLFGEWDGFTLWPLSTLVGGTLTPLRMLMVA